VSDIAAFTLAAIVAFWLAAPLWVVVVFAGIAILLAIIELTS